MSRNVYKMKTVTYRKPRPLHSFKICTMDCEAVTFDNETKSGGGSDKIDMVGFYDGEKYYQFKSGLELLDFIWVNMEKYDKAYIYAHNFSGYDIYAFLDDLNSIFVNNFSVVEVNGRFIEFSLFKSVKGKKYIVSFRDSYKLLPDKLANLGAAFGYPKTEQPPFNHYTYALPIIGGENYYQKMYDLVGTYNENDCVILYNILKKFFENIHGMYTSIPLTIPSLAFKVWKTINNVRVCSDVSNAHEFDDYIRTSYSGGRTEVFKTKVDKDEYTYIDINCYSEDTECWTEEGWKKYDKLKLGMKVMTYNTKKKKMEMKPIQKIIINHYKGNMHHYSGKNVDCLVTPNHNMIIKQHITLDEEEYVSSQCPSNCLFPNREDNSWSPADKSTIDYEGIVWCITVDNHNFLTRRNNRKAWQGNSLYPYIMETFDFPVGQGNCLNTPKEAKEFYDLNVPGFYRVKWEAPHDIYIPILWEKKNGKLTFPVNRDNQFKGEGCYALPELKLAEREGYKFEFFDAVFFPKCKNMFKDYVNIYKKMKFEGGAKKIIAKLFSNCFSDDTEAWTTEGWKKWYELKQGMQCLTVNPKTKRLEYYPIKHIFLQDYEGDMCHFQNENVDMFVTPNHRVRYLTHCKKKEKQCLAINVPNAFYLRAAGKFDGCSVLQDDFVKLLGWIITEGHFYKEGGIKITQSEHYNFEYINEIKRILTNLKIPFKEYVRGNYDTVNYPTHDFYIGTKHSKYIKSFIPDKQIQLDWLTTWSQHHLQLLFWTMLKGDGSFRKQKKATYVSKNIKELEMFQVLANMIGIKARLYYPKNNKSGTVNLKLNRNEYASINNYNNNKTNVYNKHVPYNGKVWCVSLDDREFLVRRNNKTFFSLQSLYGKFGQKTSVVSCVKLTVQQVVDLLNQGQEVSELDPLLGLYNIEVERYKEDILVSWSSYITALARCYMWEAMKRCNFDVAYTDSVIGDSIIYTDEGMKKVEDMFIEDNLICLNNKEYCQVSSKILSYNLQTNSSEYVYPQYLMRHKVNKKGYIISLNNEEKITVTEDHSVFTETNKKIHTVKGSEIKNIKNLITLKSKIRLSFKEIFLNWLRGLYYANGSYNKNYSRFSHKNYKYVQDKCIKEGYIIYSPKTGVKETDFYVKVQLGKKPSSLNMELSEDEMNEYINDIDKRQSFIRGYWYGDGTISTTKYNSYFCYSSSSKKMIEQLQYLLFLDGFESTIVRDNGINGYGSLNVCYNLKVLNSDEFFNVLGDEVYNKGTNYNIKKLSKNNSKFTRLDKDYRKRIVTSVEEIIINDYVYDFETINHTFCVKNILVHNTDSFVVKKEHIPNLWLDPKLYGAFKREYEIHRGIFISPKFYLLDVYDNEKKCDKVVLKIKGVPDVITKSIAEKGYDYAHDFIMEYAAKQIPITVNGIVQFKMSRRLKARPRSGSTRVMIKTLSLNYDKRKVCDDGIDTIPI